jgi:hypothetical protein
MSWMTYMRSWKSHRFSSHTWLGLWIYVPLHWFIFCLLHQAWLTIPSTSTYSELVWRRLFLLPTKLTSFVSGYQLCLRMTFQHETHDLSTIQDTFDQGLGWNFTTPGAFHLHVVWKKMSSCYERMRWKI